MFCLDPDPPQTASSHLSTHPLRTPAAPRRSCGSRPIDVGLGRLKMLVLAGDDLVEPLDEPVELVVIHAAELPTQPARRERPHLTDLHPRWGSQLQCLQLSR